MSNETDRSFEELTGKTIASIVQRKHSKYDEWAYLDVVCTDGTSITIVSEYGGYTGDSYDEYPRTFLFKDLGYEDSDD